VNGVCKKHRKFSRRWTSSAEEHLVISQKSPRKERTVSILRGGFATSHEPLDLTEKQGRYGEVFLKVQSLEGAGP
jgi:hypothetical protein